MADTIIKVDENSIKVNGTITTENVYSYKELINRKKIIEDIKAREVAKWDADIAKLDALIAECVKLGVGV